MATKKQYSLYPLSSPQREIWFEQLLYALVPLYNIGGYVKIGGSVNPTLFEQAVNLLIQRHDALRIVLISGTEDVDQQTVLKTLSVAVPFHDFSKQDHPHQSALTWMQEQFVQPFELYGKPLFRFALLKMSDNNCYWFKQYHHLIVDGWSISLITQSLAQIYTKLSQGKSVDTTAPSYLGFVENDRLYIESARYETHRQYWLDKYKTLPEPLFAPRYLSHTDQIPPSTRQVLSLPRYFYNQLIALAKNCQATTFHLILGALYVYFTRTSQTEELVLGLPVLNRPSATFKETVGLFVGISAARFAFGTDLSFKTLLQAIGRELTQNYRFQRLPISELNREVGLHKTGRKQLFDISVSYEKHDYKALFDSYQTHAVTLVHGYEQTPLMIYVREFHEDDDLDIDFVYNLAYFEATEIERIQSRFQLILDYVLEHAEATIQTIPLLTEAEHQQLIAWNQTETYYPKNKTIVDLFEAQVEKTPNNIAVVFETQSLTYAKLNQKANQLAHYLLNLTTTDNCSLNTGNCLVGICVERSLEMVIGLLGILKAGGAYVPLDPDYPASRLQFMLEDSQVQVLLTQSHIIEQLPALTATVVGLDSEWEQMIAYSGENQVRQSSPENLAYVIYTSGSTGQPKGAMNTHQGILNRLLWMQDAYQLTIADNVLQKTPFSFDVSVWEFFWPLLVGARLTVAKQGGHKEADYLAHTIEQEQITTLHFVPSMLQAFLQAPTLTKISSLKRVICSGEALPVELQARFFATLPTVELHNLYGPTEAAVDVTYWACQPDNLLDLVPIGHPIANIQIYILDANHTQTPLGIPGELCIAGVGLARGYFNRPELTAEKFIEVEWFGKRQRIYKTGDLARWNPEGYLEYIGRLDHQIKLRGFRIELGEIEAVLGQHPVVRETAVIVQEEAKIEQRLVAYWVPHQGQTIETTNLRRFLTEKLPEYMIPSIFVPLETMPLTPNGKIDRRALPKPERILSQLETAYVMPKTEVERKIAQVWQKVLHLEKVGIYDNFFEVGGHSLLIIQVQNELQTLFGQTLSGVKLFQYPTIHALANYLTREDRPKNTQVIKTSKAHDNSDIAIIGLSGHFPGAKDVETFWQNICEGVESITFFSDDELLAEGIDSALLSNPNYVKANGILEDIELFDAAFFGYPPREAEILDPQQRLFLECAWEAIENAGYNVDQLDAVVGVYAGVGMSGYLLNHLSSNHDLLTALGSFQLMLCNDKDFMPTRTSYKLNLKGPSVSVQTACSTSLVAVDYACQSLRDGKCDMALAGGVAIHLPQKTGYLYQQDMILSQDGHCRAFDANAQGTVGGSGVGIVVLKQLEQAVADGDYIHAVIKGSAINNDGALKVGYTAPSVDGQATVIAEAMQNIDPETITYIETHGTGTILGDPIEIAALTQAYQSRTQKKGFCALGAVKTNVGHLDTAAGIVGLIKTVLALKHKLLPPSLHFEQPNPKIDFANSPFFVNTTLSEWQSAGKLRRAGVSSFGMGGTNAHVILEEAPEPKSKRQNSNRHLQLLVLSAKTHSALETASANLAKHLEKHPTLNLADVAYTLQVGRKIFSHRAMLVCNETNEAIKILETLDPSRMTREFSEYQERPVVFLFPGLGDHYVNMAQGLYQTEPVFREHLDLCCEQLKTLLEIDLRELLYPNKTPLDPKTVEKPSTVSPARFDLRKLLNRYQEQKDPTHEKLNQTLFAQPAVFVVEYALAKLWMAWGIKPQAMIGYSLGEYVVACLAGVISLEDALRLVATRAKLIQALSGGSMLTVPLSENDIQPLLGDELCLAITSTHNQCVVSGPETAIASLEQYLLDKYIACRRLPTSHAFHSAMMKNCYEPLVGFMADMTLNSPQIPYISNLTGTWITAEQATDPHYWAKHTCQTVRFGEGLQVLLAKPEYVLLEVGPGQTLTTLAKLHPDKAGEQIAFASLPHFQNRQTDVSFLLTTLGQLWLAGVPIDWLGFHRQERFQRLPLPTYPFERQRYWIDPSKHYDRGLPQVLEGTKTSLADRFYRPLWKQSVLPTPVELNNTRSWLVFEDNCGLGSQLVKKLVQAGQNLITVQVGTGFTKTNAHNYTLNPQQREDYEKLFNELSTINQLPQKIIHLWTITSNETSNEELATRLKWVDKIQDLGFYSLLFLAQTLETQNATEKLQITVISNNIQPVTGEEELCPEKATVLGAVKIIPLEYPNITCRHIDIVLPKSSFQPEPRLLNQLWVELSQPVFDPLQLLIAYRGPYRWVQTFELIQLADQPEKRNARLRKQGVYLITGGFGGMGATFAEYLAKTLQAKLILLGRSAFPARTDWEQWLSMHNEDDAVSLKIKKVQQLEQFGAEVLVMAADVANLEQMQAVIATTEQLFGQINGVIHTAGVVDYAGVIARRTSRETTDSILAPKVNGTIILDSLLKDVELDFFIICSSWGTIYYLLKMGEVGYCAANDVLDVFSFYKTFKDNTFTVTINWSDWEEVGMGVKAIERHRAEGLKLTGVKARALENTVSPSEGIEVFNRVLAGTSPRIVLSAQNLMQLIEENALTIPNLTSALQENLSPSTHFRPELSEVYVEPRNQLEQTLADIWQKLLGIEPIGIWDDFFELGGDSLLATRVTSQVREKCKVDMLPLQVLFEGSTVAHLAEYVEASRATEQSPEATAEAERSKPLPAKNSNTQFNLPPLQPMPPDEELPLSIAQQYRWHFIQKTGETTAHNIAKVLKLEGQLDIKALQLSFKALAQRHDSLRMSFPAVDGQPTVRLLDINDPLEVVDLQALDAEPKKIETSRLIAENAQIVFNLNTGPLWRSCLLNLGEQKHLLLLNIHHIITDAWSDAIIVKDMSVFYDAYRHHREPQLPPLALQYQDYAYWQQHQWLNGEAFQQQLNYWQQQLSGIPTLLELPTDRPRPTQQSYRGATLKHRVTIALTNQLNQLSRQQSATLFMTLLAALNVLLYRYSGQNDFCVGSPVSRRHYGNENIVGFFLTPIILRAKIKNSMSFAELLQQTKQTCLTAYAHQDINFGQLLTELQPTRNPSHSPIYQVSLLLQISMKDLELAGLIEPPDLTITLVEDSAVDDSISLDLSLDIDETSNGLDCSWGYNIDIFDKKRIRWMIEDYEHLLKSIVQNPQQLVSSLPLINEVKQH